MIKMERRRQVEVMRPRMARHHFRVLTCLPNQNFHSSRKTELVAARPSSGSSKSSSSSRLRALLARVELVIFVTFPSFSFL